MLLEIFALAVRIAAGVVTLLEYVLGIKSAIDELSGKVDQAAQERAPFNIENAVNLIYQDTQALMNPMSGIIPSQTILLAAINAVRQDPAEPHLPTIKDVLDAGGTGGTVTWPTDPPGWYTAPTTPPTGSDIADAVWQVQGTYTDIGGDGYQHNTLEMLGETFKAANYQLGYAGVRSPHDSDFAIVMPAPTAFGEWHFDWVHFPTSARPAAIDWTDVLATDTPLTLLQRQQPSFGWAATGPLWTGGEHGAFAPVPSGGGAYWRNNFTGADVRAAAWATAGGGSGGSGVVVPPQPPIWPGLAGVTLGTAVDLADGLTVTGPLDGVLVTVTSTRPGAGKYAFGSTLSWVKVGGVIFCSDHGEWEWAQTIGLDAQVVTPKTMKRAASARFRVEQAATGIVQPWTINPPP